MYRYMYICICIYVPASFARCKQWKEGQGEKKRSCKSVWSLHIWGHLPPRSLSNPKKLMENLPQRFTGLQVRNCIPSTDIHRCILQQNREHLLFPLYQGGAEMKRQIWMGLRIPKQLLIQIKIYKSMQLPPICIFQYLISLKSWS